MGFCCCCCCLKPIWEAESNAGRNLVREILREHCTGARMGRAGVGKWYLVELSSKLKGDIHVLETFPSARPVLDMVTSASPY